LRPSLVDISGLSFFRKIFRGLNGGELKMFEHEKIKNIHISRYIASWYRSGGGRIYPAYFTRDPRYKSGAKTFAGWLKTLVIDGEHLTDEEVQRICSFANNGKLELEDSAKEYLSTP
jgi:hypothetical protein